MFPGKKTEHITVTLTCEQKEWLKKAAEEDQRTMSNYVAQLIREEAWLKDHARI